MTKRFFVLFGLMMCAGAAGAEPLVDGDAEAGQEKSASCAACHGPQGNMESEQFPKLAGQGAPYIYEQLKLFKSGERQNAVMAGQVAGLSKQDMRDIAAYFADQQTRPGAANEKIAPAGAKLYHGGDIEEGIPACAGCHGPAALGNAAAKYPRLSGQNPQYIAAQLKAYRDGERSGYAKAEIMNAVAEELDDEDIQALASYVAGIAPAREGFTNDMGALMQQVAGPAAAGGGSSSGGGSSESGEASSDDGGSAASNDGGADSAGESKTSDSEGSDSSSGSEQAGANGDDGANAKSADDSGKAEGDEASADSGSGDGQADDANDGESQDGE